jgi:acyl-CoA thioesterase FadM
MHIHFLHEVMKADVVDVSARILASDRKRIHAAFDMRCARYPDPVSTAEMMLLHVHQGEEPKAEAFPAEVLGALAGLALANGATASTIPGSRRMELRSRS